MTANGVDLSVYIAGASYTLGGNFQIEQLTVGTGPTATKLVRIAATNVHSAFTLGSFGSVSLTDGRGAFVIYPTKPGVANSGGIAGSVTGTFTIETLGILEGAAEITLSINTTGTAVNETVSLGGETIRIQVAAATIALSARNAKITIGDFFSLSGDFSIVSSDTNSNGVNDKLVIGARNVEIFLGSGPVPARRRLGQPGCDRRRRHRRHGRDRQVPEQRGDRHRRPGRGLHVRARRRSSGSRG